MISNKGTESFCRAFKRWCKRRQITPRYGAIGKHGVIVVIERFMRTLKSEGTRSVSTTSRAGEICPWLN